MNQDDSKDTEALVDALRADVPSAREQERFKLRLMAAGVIVASAGVPAAAAAASGSASVAGGAWGAWATKLAATSWTTKLAVVAVASAVLAAPAAVLVLSPRRPAEEGLVSARPHAAVAASAIAGVAAPSAERSTAVTPTVDVDTQPQPMAASASVVAKAPSRTSRASTEPPRGPLPPRRQLATRTTPGASASADATGIAAQPHPQPTAASTAPDPASRTALEGAPESANASGLAPNSTQPKAAPPASVIPVDDAQPAQPAAADQPAKFYAGPELARPRLAGVRRSPASELARETQLIERALAALRVDDVPAARSWLNLHAARYPDGLLSRDRERVLRRIEASGTEHERQSP